MNETPETSRSSHRRPPLAILLIFGLILLLGVFFALLPFGVQWYLADWLRDRGVVNVSINDIDINPFTAELDLEALEYEDDSGRQRAGYVRVNLSWSDLLDKRIRLTSVVLQDSTLIVRRTESNRWLLGTIVLGAQEAVAEAEQVDAGSGLGFGIDELQIDNVTVDYRDPLVTRQLTIEKLTLKDFATWEADQDTRLDLMLTSGDARLSVAGDARPFAAIAGLKLAVNGVDLDAGGLEALLQQIGIESVSGVMQADFDVALSLDAATTIVVNGSAALEDWTLSRPDESHHLHRLSWDGELNLNLAESGNRITAKGDAELQELALTTPELSLSVAASGWKGTTTVLMTDPELTVEFDGTLDTEGARFSDTASQLAAALDSLRWQLKGTTSNAYGWRLDAAGDLTALGIAAGTLRQPAMLQIGTLTTRMIIPPATSLLAVDALKVSELQLIDRPDPAADDATHLLELAAIDVAGITFAADNLVLGETLLGGLQIWLERTQEGALELDSLLGADAEPAIAVEVSADNPANEEHKVEAGSTETADSEPSALNFSLAGLKTAADSRLFFVDRSVRPIVKLELRPLEIELGRLDSAQRDTDTSVNVKATQAKYGTIAFAGQLRPLAKQSFVQGSGQIRDLNMIALNGFARRALGYRITAGTMSADVDVDLQDQTLDSTADLTIRRLEITPLKADQQDEFSTELGVPLGTALGLLEDDEDTIRLSIPLQGELSQLSVGVGDAIRLVVQKGLMAGLQTAATTYFAPLWPALAATKLFAVAMQLSFEDIVFTAGASELSDEQQEYVQNMATLLAKRSKVSLSLCGRAVAADAATLFADVGVELDSEQLAAMAGLAERRHEAVKDLLIEAGIASERLVTCSPEAKAADKGPPRVDFGT